MKNRVREFQVASKRTAPFNGEPENKVELQHLITNYTLGLNGEFMEFENEINSHSSEESVFKEAGDVLHYAVILLETLGKKTTDENIGLKIVYKKDVSEALCNTLEITKKTFYHLHEFDEKKFVKSVKTVIDYIYDQLGEENFYTALDMNIKKLLERYPDEFSVEDSIARVDV